MRSLSDIAPIDIVEGCTPEAIPDHILTSEKPLLLKGLVAGWPAVHACNHSITSAATYLANYWSNDPVTVYVSDENIDGRFFYNDDFTGFNFRGGKAHLSQVIEKLAKQQAEPSGESIYMGSTNIDHWLPGFRKDNDLRLPVVSELASIWIGNSTRISAHYDFPDNLACVVAGNRRFTLFPPDQISNLYVGPLDRTPSGQAISLVDFVNPDFDRFPKFAIALENALSCEMIPGDAIFIPGMWWHHVEALSSFNILVNYWWSASSQFLGSPTPALMHAILALRDLPERQRKAWQGLFEHYVFSADESVFAHIPESGRGCLAPLDEASARMLRADLLNRLKQ